MDKAQIQDYTLWNAFKQGDKNAFEEIYRREVHVLINYGKKLGKSEDIIKDNIQDLFIELWKSRERLNKTSNIRFYLFKALRNKLSKSKNLDFTIDTHQSDPQISIEQELILQEFEEEQTTKLKNLILKLTKRQKEAIFLRYFNDMSISEVASVMDINYQSAAKLIYSSLKFLRKTFPKLPYNQLFIFCY